MAGKNIRSKQSGKLGASVNARAGVTAKAAASKTMTPEHTIQKFLAENANKTFTIDDLHQKAGLNTPLVSDVSRTVNSLVDKGHVERFRGGYDIKPSFSITKDGAKNIGIVHAGRFG